MRMPAPGRARVGRARGYGQRPLRLYASAGIRRCTSAVQELAPPRGSALPGRQPGKWDPWEPSAVPRMMPVPTRSPIGATDRSGNAGFGNATVVIPKNNSTM